MFGKKKDHPSQGQGWSCKTMVLRVFKPVILGSA